MSDDRVEIVRRAFEQWAAGDLDGALESADEQIEFWPLAAQLKGEPYVGKRAVRRFATEEVPEQFEYARINVEDVRPGSEDYVLATGNFEARGRASGIPADFSVAIVIRFEGDKVVYQRFYTDLEAARRAAGLSE